MSDRYLRDIELLNDNNVNVRLSSLKNLIDAVNMGELPRPVKGNDVNNHIHTIYSFSPYSPSKAIWMAFNAGLTTVGIMDHDSISGAEEFIEAGSIAGMATTIGAECRVDFSGTPLKGRRINNPDQTSIAYMAIHGIPHTQIGVVKDFFAPFARERNKRNALMLERINSYLRDFDIKLSFEEDIIPLSKSSEGGSITERHILFGLSKKLIELFGKGERLTAFLKDKLKLEISSKILGLLTDGNNPYYDYDLLGLLKGELVSHFYIDAALECPPVEEVIALCNRIGAIAAYAYLGDVGDSVTGDKKSQRFEDEYLELLFKVIKELGFHAVTYMPSRNTIVQLKRLKKLCGEFGFFEISGEDINSPRQSFVCSALRNEEFKNLIDSTWALIGHERAAAEALENGMFSAQTIEKYPKINQRIEIYKNIGRGGL
ncbi:PHP domain-containing protein [Anaerobacterium chartisolvens]|uniref:PHP domain-containing protein n=1 Tax=Anaerobacterium chartisolvens TaxID=1297424 RepID=A0A369ASM0_9FIRM|nr:PHP domain-containing protein [Anaerobacterium chartisolvens]RCX12339.1 PHP domain-containing protein [Anaerobacterium chartisolvens]